jgi:polyphosphate kinase 2 (PPK2 family)
VILRLVKRVQLFNRSWYNRTGVERVMASAADEYALFLRQARGSRAGWPTSALGC